MFAVPTPHAGVNGIAPAPDNSIWFTEKGAGKIGVVTSLGQLTEYAARSGDTPVDITSCPSGISSSMYGVVVTADNSSSGAVLDISRVDNGTFTSERDDTVFSNDPASTSYGTTCRPSTSQATRQYGGSHEPPEFDGIDASVDVDSDGGVGSETMGF